MGLPQLDFRVPEGTWLKSALNSARNSALVGKFARMPGLSRLGSMPGLSSTGALAWPYKVAVVAVMALVACGTLVTFGSAGAETPSSAEVAALPGTDEASPSVEGQVLPPTNQALLNSDDLLSSLNLTDYSPDDTTAFSLFDDDEDNDDENTDDDNDDETEKKKSSTKTTSTPKPTATNTNDDDEDTDPVEGPKHKQWVEDRAEYEDANADYQDAKEALGDWEDENETYQDCRRNPLKYMGKNCDKDYNPGTKPTVPSEPQSPGAEPDFES